MFNAHDAPLPSVEEQQVVTMLFPSLSKLKVSAREGTTPALPSKVMLQTAKPTSTSRGFQCQQSNYITPRFKGRIQLNCIKKRWSHSEDGKIRSQCLEGLSDLSPIAGEATRNCSESLCFLKHMSALHPHRRLTMWQLPPQEGPLWRPQWLSETLALTFSQPVFLKAQ